MVLKGLSDLQEQLWELHAPDHLTKSVLVCYFFITNYHKLSSLKQHTVIIVQFLWSKVQGGATGSFAKVLTELISLLTGRSGEDSAASVLRSSASAVEWRPV